MTTAFFESPLGWVRIVGDEEGVASISCKDVSPSEAVTDQDLPKPVEQAIEQLQEYFGGVRKQFDFTMKPAGTPFQQMVWRALLDVPFGTTLSYFALTRRIGDEKAIRAVAAANGKNPVWIVVPCHRIIGSDGSLTGYAGGLWRKQWLLEHEGCFKQLRLF